MIMDIIGHQSQLAQLKQELAKNLAHAYLFSGPKAVGKFTSALWFAEQLIGQPFTLTHPDIHVVDKLWIDTQQDNWDDIASSSNNPQKHRAKKPTAKTDTITLDDIHALQEQLHRSPNGPHRVCIIKNVQRLNTSAANALLKTIEEPPPKLIFILTTSSPQQLLETIVSRCRIVQFGKAADNEINNLLQTINPASHQFVKDIANGAPGIVMRCIDEQYLAKQQELYQAAAKFFTSNRPNERLEALKNLSVKGEDQHNFIEYLWLHAKKNNADTVAVKALTKITAALKTNTSKDVITAYMLQCQ